MFRTFARLFLPNPFDWMLKRTEKKGGKRVLLAWNRGLGDIALGLYAMVQRIREIIPGAEITFLVRENLKDGFSLLEGVETIVDPSWKRGSAVDVKHALHRLGIDPKRFDLIIEKPSPTDWVQWQRGKVVPRLRWNRDHEDLWKKFGLEEGFTYIGVQAVAETNYGLWRNWPLERWQELFERLQQREKVRVLLFGFGEEPKFLQKNVIDLRGKTNLFELLSVIKHRCYALILPDSGVLSMSYYLDESFPLRVISLWADPNHGILKQAVASPNPQLKHIPLIGDHRDLSTVSVDAVLQAVFPVRPLMWCPRIETVEKRGVEKVGCIILAGGQGTRLGANGPKGLFSLQGKTLFEWIFARIDLEGAPIAIMTSPLNHEETVAYFRKRDFFGREILFFQQAVRPLLDEEKRPLPVFGPNGNGDVFRAFVQAGLGQKFRERGVDLITVIPVDNPLAVPFDAALISYARAEKADVTIKCVERRPTDHPMGVLVEREGKIEILEYGDVPQDGTQYEYANVGHFAFTLPFFEKMSSQDLPIHWVQKKVPIGGQTVAIWKGEQFIFDALPFADCVRAVAASKESCYAPLKTQENIHYIEKLLS